MVATPGTATETPTTAAGDEPENVEPPEGTETPSTGPFTAKDRDNLQLALTKSRTAQRELAAKVTALEQEHATADEKVWMTKVDEATHMADDKLKKIAARSALVAAGLQGKPDRLAAVLDLDAIEVDDDGNVSGLEAQVKDLKKEYPGLFSTTTDGKTSVGQLNIGSRPGPKPKAKGYAQVLADQIMSGSS